MITRTKPLACFLSRTIAALLCLCLIETQLALPADAQTSASTAPVPAQIAAAHKVFLTNAVADPNFPIDSGNAFNDVYAKLQNWGRFQLVSSPDQADLVFQLRDIAPITNVSGTNGRVYSSTSPAFQLNIRDPKSNVVIWTITSPVYVRTSRKVYAHWVSVAETNLVSRIKVLANVPLTPEETASLTTYPKTHGVAVGIIVAAGIVGLGVGSYFLIHHLYENSLAKQKQDQDNSATPTASRSACAPADKQVLRAARERAGPSGP